MKIIDEKGRLFGKLNLIDLLVTILLIAAVAAVAWKLVGKKAAETVADTGRTITYTVTVEDVNREAAEFASTQIGKSLVNNSKVVDAAITNAADADRAAIGQIITGVQRLVLGNHQRLARGDFHCPGEGQFGARAGADLAGVAEEEQAPPVHFTASPVFIGGNEGAAAVCGRCRPAARPPR